MESKSNLLIRLAFVLVLLRLLSSCGANEAHYNERFVDQVAVQKFVANLSSDMEQIANSTMSLVQPDQMQSLATFLDKSSWTPVFNDRFSLSAAGSPPFPAHNGIPQYLPNLFHALSPLASIKPMGNVLSCNIQPKREGCNQASRKSLCQNILTELGLSGVSDKSLSDLYMYLTGFEASVADLTSLKSVAATASSQTVYSNSMEFVCFSIMQSARFLTL